MLLIGRKINFRSKKSIRFGLSSY